jgi:tetratricopeptide (TPR) repeat protein
MTHRALVPLLFALACTSTTPSAPPAKPTPAPVPAVAEKKEERFDLLVRDDFFAALLERDQAALERALKLCEQTLARDPEHAEAMVWHGGGLILKASAAFQSGQREAGMKLWTEGLAEMDRAVELAPDSVGTRIPRGATLLAASPFIPEPQRTQLLDKGLGDYERVLQIQAAYFDRLSKHARTQLLFGLADGWNRRGDLEKARGYYERVRAIAGGTAYGERAEAYLAGDTAAKPMSCGGCHGI